MPPPPKPTPETHPPSPPAPDITRAERILDVAQELLHGDLQALEAPIHGLAALASICVGEAKRPPFCLLVFVSFPLFCCFVVVLGCLWVFYLVCFCVFLLGGGGVLAVQEKPKKKKNTKSGGVFFFEGEVLAVQRETEREKNAGWGGSHFDKDAHRHISGGHMFAKQQKRMGQGGGGGSCLNTHTHKGHETHKTEELLGLGTFFWRFQDKLQLLGPYCPTSKQNFIPNASSCFCDLQLGVAQN